MTRAAVALSIALLAGCTGGLRDDVLEPKLTEAVLDPAMLGDLCGVPPAEIGPPSRSRLAITDLRNERSALGSEGSGSASVAYRPIAGPRQDETCRGTVTFEFDDGGARVTHDSVQITALRVTPSS